MYAFLIVIVLPFVFIWMLDAYPKAVLPLIACLVFWAVTSKAEAAECSPTVTVSSYHFNRAHDYNERNYGLGVTCDRWSVGQYRNSEYARSTYLFYNYPINAHFGVTTGLVSGYAYSPILPVVALYAKVGVIRLVIVPFVVVGAQIVLPIKFGS